MRKEKSPCQLVYSSTSKIEKKFFLFFYPHTPITPSLFRQESISLTDIPVYAFNGREQNFPKQVKPHCVIPT